MNKKVCSIDGCKNKYLSNGFCSTHYKRFKKYGDPLYLKNPHNIYDKCTVDECTSVHYCKGYCIKHYQRWRKHGNPLVALVEFNYRGHMGCSVEDCDGNHSAMGYCQKHYVRLKTHGNPHINKLPRLKKCKVEKCYEMPVNTGYCKKHYNTEYKRWKTQSRKARIKKAPINDFTLSDWKECLTYFNNSCAYCGEKGTKFHQEHVVPISRNGSNTKTNIVPSCPDCNYSKNDRTIEEWYLFHPFYDKDREMKILKWIEM